MPLTPFEIAMSKVWANGLVITVAVGLSLYFVVRAMLGVPIAGSIPLFMVGVVIYLFFACAIGIFLGTVARSMPQLGLLLHAGLYADEHALRQQHAARKHAALARRPRCRRRPRRISYRSRRRSCIAGAGIDVVWPQFLLVAAIGGVFFVISIWRFRSSMAQSAS